MTKYKLVFILLSLIILQNEFTKLSAQHYKSFDEKQIMILESIINNPTGRIYFFDDREISERDFYVKIFTRQLKGMTTSIWEGKNAILIFGERFRNGIIFGESEENIENNKEHEKE